MKRNCLRHMYALTFVFAYTCLCLLLYQDIFVTAGLLLRTSMEDFLGVKETCKRSALTLF